MIDLPPLLFPMLRRAFPWTLPTSLPMVALMGGLLLLTGLTACRPSGSTGTSAEETPAEFDLAALISRYSESRYYSDEASVILHYSLDSAPYEEIHPCSMQLIRDDRHSLRRFKLEIANRTDVSTARALDPETQNLGGQVLCRREKMMDFRDSLLQDSIAVHFAQGGDDIPWNSTLTPGDIDELLSLPLLLFYGQPPAWMTTENMTRTTEVEVDGKLFVDAFFESRLGPIACRFDVQQQALSGIRLPGELLSSRLATTPGVRDVSLAIIYQQFSFEECQPQPPRLNEHEQPVREFVQLPEAFPSPMIGKPMQAWGLVDRNQSAFDPNLATGAAAVYFYGLQQQYTSDELDTIETLTRQHPAVNFAWIFPTAGDKHLGEKHPFSRMGYFFDAQGKLLEGLGVDQTIVAWITDASGKIQYLSGRDQDWPSDLGPVIQRVQQGDEVAREMHHEYAAYHAEYLERLRALRPNPILLDILRNP